MNYGIIFFFHFAQNLRRRKTDAYNFRTCLLHLHDKCSRIYIYHDGGGGGSFASNEKKKYYEKSVLFG